MDGAAATSDEPGPSLMENLTIRVQPGLKARMLKQAESEHRTLSNWVRGLAMRELDRVGG